MSQAKSKQQPIKSQHYVPRFYLKKFANEKDQIYVLDTKTRTVFLRNISKICCENWLYETEWEKAVPQMGKRVLENNIENELSKKEAEYAQTIRSILSRCENASENTLICRTVDKRLLRDFVVNLILRNPKNLDEITNDYCNENWRDNENICPYLACLEMLQWGDADSLLRHAVKNGVLFENVSGSPLSVHTEELERLNICFLKSNDAEFITSSHPFVEVADKAGSRLDSVLVPLSPTILLCFFSPELLHPFRNRVRKISNEAVLSINKLYLKMSSQEAQYILAKSKKSIDLLKFDDYA